jgi:hypothetical protein
LERLNTRLQQNLDDMELEMRELAAVRDEETRKRADYEQVGYRQQAGRL